MFLLPVTVLQAQNEDDILRYARLGMVGSVRTLGAGGAWGAVGADLSSASLNPAGLGFYRRNEVMISASLYANASSSDYLGQNSFDSRTSFNIPNLGIVFNNQYQEKGKDPSNGIVSTNLAFGMNRLNSFQDNIFYSGNSQNSSITDYWAKTSYGIDKSDLLASDNISFRALAYQTYLIDTAVGKNNAYLSVFNYSNDTNYLVKQSTSIQNRGNMLQWYASGGLNYANWLYLGASVFFDKVSSEQTITYNENIEKVSAGNPFKSLQTTQSITTTGSGLGAKLGIIVTPMPFLRLGAAYSTPVRINLTDNYSNSLSANYSSGQSFTVPQNTIAAESDYQVVTPERILLSGAIISKNLGIITADYEMVNYAEGRLEKQSIPQFQQANQVARSIYRSAINFRAGSEFRFDNYRLRFGYAYMQTPYINGYKNSDTKAYTIGAGTLWGDGYFADAAIVYMSNNLFNTNYPDHTASILSTRTMISFGIGARF